MSKVLTNLEKMHDLVDKYGQLKEKCKAYEPDLKALKKLDDEICKLADELTEKDKGDDFFGDKFKIHVSAKNKAMSWVAGAYDTIMKKIGKKKFYEIISVSKGAAEEVLTGEELAEMTVEEYKGKRSIKTCVVIE